MECFENLIGIKNTCDAPVSKSGLWLQNLSGFSLKLADAANSEEHSNGLALIKEKYEMAISSISAHFQNQYSDKIKTNSIIENEKIGYYPINLKSITLDNSFLKGIKIELQNSSYIDIYISQVSLLFKDVVVDAPIYIYNLSTGKLLDTFEVTTLAGEPTKLTINKTYKSNGQNLSLFICFDAGLSDVLNANLYSTSNNCTGCTGVTYGNKYTSVGSYKIAKSSQKINTNLSSTSGTSGMSVDYSLNCSIENWLCSISGKFAYPLLYKWGVEIMNELIYSRRLNSIITIDSQKNKELRDYYESEYMSSMNAILNNIAIPKSVCFDCNKKIVKTVSIP